MDVVKYHMDMSGYQSSRDPELYVTTIAATLFLLLVFELTAGETCQPLSGTY